jgi:NAD(P)H-hydrate epimerase
MESITADSVKEKLHLIKRAEDANKTDLGHLLICAGSFGMAGAAVMCGTGALKCGSGLVSFYCQKEIIPILQISLPQAMCIDIDSNVTMMKYSAIAIGPGFLIKSGEKSLSRFISGYAGTMVIDAQSLNVLAERRGLMDELKRRSGDSVLTPHEGEMARLLGVESKAVKEDRIGAALRLHDLTGSTIVLKGSGTIIVKKDGSALINTTGNPGMATGGSGDVLTGMTAAPAAQGMCADDAAECGVFLHGMAADICRRYTGEISMTAMDIADAVPFAFIEVIG